MLLFSNHAAASRVKSAGASVPSATAAQGTRASKCGTSAQNVHLEKGNAHACFQSRSRAHRGCSVQRDNASRSARRQCAGRLDRRHGRGAVEIKPCGAKLCGHVVWVKSAGDAKGCGRQIIGDAVATGKVAHGGWIYSPEKRKRYNVELSPLADGRLKVLGYAGTKLFSKTMYWTPAAANLERCGSTTAAAAPASTVPPAPVALKPAPIASAPPVPLDTQAAQAPRVAAPAAPAKQPAAEGSGAPAAAAAAVAKPVTKPETAPAQPEPKAGEQQAAASGSDIETENQEPPRRLAEILDQVLTKSADGNCRLDLPWVKVKFRCEKN